MEAHKYTLRFTDCRYSRYLSVSGLFDILEDIFDTVDMYADKLTAKAYRPLADKIKLYKKE